jgi:hypothetical protein
MEFSAHYIAVPRDRGHFQFTMVSSMPSAFVSSRQEVSLDNLECSPSPLTLRLHSKIGPPSQHEFENILNNNLILKCPVTIDDAKRAITIYGPDTATLNGKTTKGPSQHVPLLKPVSLPAQLLADHKDVTRDHQH